METIDGDRGKGMREIPDAHENQKLSLIPVNWGISLQPVTLGSWFTRIGALNNSSKISLSALTDPRRQESTVLLTMQAKLLSYMIEGDLQEERNARPFLIKAGAYISGEAHEVRQEAIEDQSTAIPQHCRLVLVREYSSTLVLRTPLRASPR